MDEINAAASVVVSRLVEETFYYVLKRQQSFINFVEHFCSQPSVITIIRKSESIIYQNFTELVKKKLSLGKLAAYSLKYKK